MRTVSWPAMGWLAGMMLLTPVARSQPRPYIGYVYPAGDSSTLLAVRRAYELLGEDLCATCPRRQERQADKGDWYYVI